MAPASPSAIRVLWLAKGLGRGGAEMLLVSLARAMRGSGIELHVAYTLPHKDALVEDLRAQGVEVHLLGDGSRSGWIRDLRSLLAEGDFHIVHSHAPVIGAVARTMTPRGSVVLHTEHNTWDRYRRATRWANALTLGRVAKVWAVSEGVARSIRPPLADRWAPPVEVMLHGIDPAEAKQGEAARRAAHERLGLEPGPLTLGTVGNLTPKKDHASLLEAFAELRRTHPDARLAIIGTGPQEGRLRTQAHALGLDGAVLFLGIRDDVTTILPAFDVFVLSSLHEGLSIAVIEALAAGLPVVATRVGGIPEVIREGVEGLLVPAADPHALCAALERLADDDELRARLAAAAPARAAHFGIDDAAGTLQREYAAYASAVDATRGVAR